MSPRPGGEADKMGNKYEAAWAIRYALGCIDDDRCSLTLEDNDGDLGKGSEFTYVSATSTEVHQLKRQNGISNSWTVTSLANHSIFASASIHIAAGREFHFVSMVPCRPLQELTERARQALDLNSFTQTWLTVELSAVFDEVAAPRILGSAQKAWETLRGMWFSVHDERDVIRTNGMLAGSKLTGATGHLIALAIGDILLDNLGRRLTRTELLDLLAQQDICLLAEASRQKANEQVNAVTNSWRDSVRRELLHPRIERVEASQLIEALLEKRIGFVTGTAGGGKSSVLEQSVELLEAAGAKVLAFRLDRLAHFASTADLNLQLGLEVPPAEVLTRAAENQDTYLVIDQLDAVSIASGRIPNSFDAIADLIGEALSVPGIRVILACREFDIDNDHRIRSMIERPDTVKVSVGALSADEVNAAVTVMGLDAAQLTASQHEILRTPMHLVLLETIADQEGALAFQSRGSLFEAYWERKRQMSKVRRAGVQFNVVLSRVANVASDRQMLSIPIEILDDGDLIEDANVLVSEQVLVRDGDRIAFFHETFFDYVFARQWVSRTESLVEFLLRNEQELFRRAQVRQILQYLYERDPERFRDETADVLTSEQVRFHIKETVLAVLSNLEAPSTEDAELIFEVASVTPRLEEQLWSNICRTPWFRRFHEDGTIAAWLDSNGTNLQQRAIDLMSDAVEDRTKEVTELLSSRQGASEYSNWLRRIARVAKIHRHRPLFELLLVAIRENRFDAYTRELWLSVFDLAKHKPLWAIELIQGRVVDHSEGIQLNENGRVSLLNLREPRLAMLVRESAEAEPMAFAQAVVPYLCRVMTITEYEPRANTPIRDRHFSARFDFEGHRSGDLGNVLFSSSVRALESLARNSPHEIRPLLEELASDPHDSAQFLLYRALAAGAGDFSQWAATLILEGSTSLEYGHLSGSIWTVRELVQAVAPYLSDDVHWQLEEEFRDLINGYEGRQNFGRSAFTLLTALNEQRLSQLGVRRLEEYRRKFKESAPAKSQGLMGGGIGSPISSGSSVKMSDEQWLKAIERYDTDETNWDTAIGGARELSHVLRERAAADPSRFALLALKLTSKHHEAYAESLLLGLSNADKAEKTAQQVFDAVRHIASLGHVSIDHCLGDALRRYSRDVPLDLVELLRDRAIQSPNPSDDSPILISEGSDGRKASDMYVNAINTARGSLAEALGDILIYDADGVRTEIVRPYLQTLASDPVIFVRVCVAHTLAASLRHARPDVIEAFDKLVDAEDRILGTSMVQRLMHYIGNVDPTIIDPVMKRMLASEDTEVREAGGSLASFAALEWDRPELMTRVLAGDSKTRKGAAEVCAYRFDTSSSPALACSTLIELMNDSEDEVREAAAELAAHLRGRALQPFTDLLIALIESPAFEQAMPQLILTLQHAPDRVDELVLKTSQRFISVFANEVGDMRSGVAGDAHEISELVVRGLAQSRNKAHRAALLDVLDSLFELGAYGVDDAVAGAERL